MMKIYTYIISLVIVLFIACSDRELIPNQVVDKPVAIFSMSVDTCSVPCQITFSNSSVNAKSFFWDFGDGSIDTVRNPVHIYQKTGEFTVTLTTAGTNNLTNDTSSKVVILPQDTVEESLTSFTIVSSSSGGISPDSVCFLNSSINVDSSYWDFGDGTVISTLKDTVCHIFGETGIFTVRLVTSFGQNSDTSEIEIIIEETVPPPLAEFTFSNDSCLAPCNISITNNSQNADSFNWSFGDGTNSNSAKESFEHMYNEAGSYTITLVASIENLSDTSSKGVTILDSSEVPLPIADFTILNDSCEAICEIGFENRSENAIFFEWDFGDGNTSTEAHPSYVYSEPGRYEVSLKASNSFGSSSKISTVTINETTDTCDSAPLFLTPGDQKSFGTPFEVQFSSNSTDTGFDYNWNFGDGSPPSNEINPVHRFEAVEAIQNVPVTLTLTKGNLACTYSEVLTLYEGPIPGKIRITYLDDLGRITHASPFSAEKDSTLIGLAPFEGLGELVDMEVDYKKRIIYALITNGNDPIIAENEPQIWICNLNGTGLRKIYSNPEFVRDSYLNLDLNDTNGDLHFISKSIGNSPYELRRARLLANDLFTLNTGDRIIGGSLFFIDQITYISFVNRVAYVTEEKQVQLVKAYTLPAKLGDLPITLIQSEPGEKFSGLTINFTTQDIVLHRSTTSDIRMYSAVNGTFKNILVSKVKEPSRIATYHNLEAVYWIESAVDRFIIRSSPFGGASPSVFSQNVGNKYVLEVGRFE